MATTLTSDWSQQGFHFWNSATMNSRRLRRKFKLSFDFRSHRGSYWLADLWENNVDHARLHLDDERRGHLRGKEETETKGHADNVDPHDARDVVWCGGMSCFPSSSSSSRWLAKTSMPWAGPASHNATFLRSLCSSFARLAPPPPPPRWRLGEFVFASAFQAWHGLLIVAPRHSQLVKLGLAGE